jgi:hypothetical protein
VEKKSLKKNIPIENGNRVSKRSRKFQKDIEEAREE